MAKRSDPFESPYLRLLLYGIPGSLKTRTAGTACLDERTSPVLWLDAAGNPVSIRDYPEHPDIIMVEELKDLNDPYNWIREGQPANHPFVKRFNLRPPYKCLVVDQITDVQRLSYNLVTGNTTTGPGDIPKAHQIQHFMGILNQMVNFAKSYYSLPLHVIMTAQEKTETDTTTGLTRNAPLLWGQADTEVPGYANVVARMVHRAVTKTALLKVIEDATLEKVIDGVALFLPSGKYVAKDQFGRLGSYIVDPTVTKMLDLIYGIGGNQSTNQPTITTQLKEN